MNNKKVFVVIAVLLVALVSMSSIIYASQEGNAKSDLITAQSGNETQQEDAEADEKVRYMFVQSGRVGGGLTTSVPSSNRTYGFPVYGSPMALPHCRE